MYYKQKELRKFNYFTLQIVNKSHSIEIGICIIAYAY